MVVFQVGPEQPGEHVCQVGQGRIVQHGGPFGQVVDQQVAYFPAGDGVVVDHLAGSELPAGLGLA
jgi:hypothetical protein